MTPPRTEVDPPNLEELRRLEAAATPGPWSLGDAEDGKNYDGEDWPQVWPPLGAPVADLNGRPGAKDKDRADAALIVALRNAAPALLADDLGAAWRAAEAACSENDPDAPWMVEVGRRESINGAVNPHTGYTLEAYPEHYFASASIEWTTYYIEAFGPTPAAALRALVDALGEAGKVQP